MFARLHALKFMVRLTLERFGHLSVREISLAAGRKKQPALVYEPPDQVFGNVLFVHGMSVQGSKDPRVNIVCRALASAGYRAIAPQYDDIQKLLIAPRQVDQIESSLVAASMHPELGDGKPIGLMAPSFSAGLGIIAAARGPARNRVAALCAIGGFSHVDTAMQFLLGAERADDYGMMVVLWNFGPLALKAHPALFRAIKERALDNGFRREGAQQRAPALIAKLPASERKLMQRLMESSAYRLSVSRAILKSKQADLIYPKISPARYLAALDAPVAIVHGVADNVIPPEESTNLFAELKRLGKPARLCLTPFLSHGDAGLRFSMAAEVLELAATFGFFFQHVRAAAQG
ncbi:MAG: prolyl oligopeptidase family serine peptidase [Leptospirales bacterium]|nr:prolyl oligopeptidase family serine peptidase [Leptospirales bacterium]